MMDSFRDLADSQRVVVGVAAAVILVALGLLLMPVSVEWEETRGSSRSFHDDAGELITVDFGRSCGPAVLASLGLSPAPSNPVRAVRSSGLCTEGGRERVVQGIVLGGLAFAGGWGGVRLLDGAPKPQTWPSRPGFRPPGDASSGKDSGG